MKNATKANPALNDNQSGLAVSYPAATFDDKLAREVDTATEFETTAPTLANAVKTANLSDTARLQAEQTVREAGKAHLAHCCMIGACVQQVYHLASVSGLGIKPLFKNYFKKDARAVKLAHGACFNFTYESGNKYRKLFLGIRERMLANGGMTEQAFERLISEHIQAMVTGQDLGPQEIFGDFLSGDSLRQEMLALFPPAPPTPGEMIQAENNNATPATSWEAQRQQHKQDFAGYLACIDTYITRACSYTTKEDREAQAQALEMAARRLRAAETQPNLPKLEND